MPDNRCSTRKEDWTRFLKALIGRGNENRNSIPILNYFLSIGHTFKNVIVEEWRRWNGECP